MTYTATAYTSFRGSIYWKAHDQCVMGWDSALGLLGFTDITAGVSPAGASADGIRFGAPSLLGSGDLLIPANSNLSEGHPNVYYGTTDWQDGFTVTRTLDLAGSRRWLTPWNSWWGSNGIPGNVYCDYDSGVYDPVTKLNWWARTYGLAGDPATYVNTEGNGEPTPPWFLFAYDNDGNFVEGVGQNKEADNHFGDGYTGATTPTEVCRMGRWIYRQLTYADGVGRYNLDTQVYEAVLHQVDDQGRQIGYFLGVNEREGTYVTAHRDTGFIQVRDPNEGWRAMPDARGLEGAENTVLPLREYDPSLYDPSLSYYTYSTSRARASCTLGGKLYYTGSYGYTGVLGDPLYAIFAMDLMNGSIEKIVDIPLIAFDENGVMTEDPDQWFRDNSGTPTGLLVVPPSGAITGKQVGGRARFTG